MRGLFVSLGLLCVMATPCAIGSEDAALKRMEDLIQDRVSAGEFSGTVLVAKGTAIVFERSYGYSDFTKRNPVTPETRFQIGSMTKQFTAAAVMKLEERGLLKLDEPIQKFVPEVTGAWNNVTLFHLLTHTSGIPDYTQSPDFLASVATPTTPHGLVDRIKNKSLVFAPGAKYEYSNSNYVLLGVVIEKTSGEPYGEFLKQQLFAPLGMGDTSYGPGSAPADRNAKGYFPTKSGPTDSPLADWSVAYAAGGLFSTAHDMLRWQQALHHGRVISPASVERMTTPYKGDYGFGLTIEQRYWHFLKMLFGIGGTRLIHHGGATLGFSSHMAYYPEQDMTIAVLGNVYGMAPLSLARRLATVAFNEPDWAPARLANKGQQRAGIQ